MRFGEPLFNQPLCFAERDRFVRFAERLLVLATQFKKPGRACPCGSDCGHPVRGEFHLVEGLLGIDQTGVLAVALPHPGTGHPAQGVRLILNGQLFEQFLRGLHRSPAFDRFLGVGSEEREGEFKQVDGLVELRLIKFGVNLLQSCRGQPHFAALLGELRRRLTKSLGGVLKHRPRPKEFGFAGGVVREFIGLRDHPFGLHGDQPRERKRRLGATGVGGVARQELVEIRLGFGHERRAFPVVTFTRREFELGPRSLQRDHRKRAGVRIFLGQVRKVFERQIRRPVLSQPARQVDRV